MHSSCRCRCCCAWMSRAPSHTHHIYLLDSGPPLDQSSREAWAETNRAMIDHPVCLPVGGVDASRACALLLPASLLISVGGIQILVLILVLHFHRLASLLFDRSKKQSSR